MSDACSYDGCSNPANDYDCDGNEACAEHAAKSERYVIVMQFDEEWCAFTSDEAERVEAIMLERGWRVEIREPWRGEAEGTYLRRNDGTLQILGYSIPVPDAFKYAYLEASNSVR